MSEHLPIKSPEIQSEIPTSSEVEQPINKETDQQRVEAAESITKLRAEIHEQADSTEEVNARSTEHEVQHHPDLSFHRELKADAYQHVLQKTQSRLSTPNRAFSRFTHRPVIDALSTATAQTIVRPSGVLVGSALTLVGSIILLYMTKHYGFRYNYAVFFLLFLGGFLVGITTEAIWKKLKGHQN